jgi:hypothetical protein
MTARSSSLPEVSVSPRARSALAVVVLVMLAGCSSGDAVPTAENAAIATGSAAATTASSTPASSGPSVSAAGSPSASISPAPTVATPGVSPSGGVVLKAPTLPVVPGYTYAAAPKAVADAFAAEPVAHPLSAPTVRAVVHDKVSLGSVAARTLDPAHVGDRELEGSLVAGLVTGMSGQGYTVRTRRVSGASVTVALRKDSTILVWYDRGLVYQLITSEDEATGLGYVTASLKR